MKKVVEKADRLNMNFHRITPAGVLRTDHRVREAEVSRSSSDCSLPGGGGERSESTIF